MPTSPKPSSLQAGPPTEVPIGPGVYLSELETPMQEAKDLPNAFHRHADRLLNPPWLARILIGAFVWVLDNTIHRNPKLDKFEKSQ